MPATRDLFSMYGVRNIGQTLPRWKKSSDSLCNAIKPQLRYLFPEKFVQFLGYTIYNARGRKDQPLDIATAHQNYAIQIPEQIKIHLETQAKLYIQAKIKEGLYSLVWSYIMDYENGRNPYEEKRRAISPWKQIASECILEETEDILIFAESLSEKGIKTYDDFHIACAVYAKCEFYLTTDKKLLNTPVPEIKIVDPIKFVNEMEG